MYISLPRAVDTYFLQCAAPKEPITGVNNRVVAAFKDQSVEADTITSGRASPEGFGSEGLADELANMELGRGKARSIE